MESSPVLSLEGERTALGPLVPELAPLYAKWDNDLLLSALRGRAMRPSTTAEAEQLVAQEHAGSVFFTVYETVFEHKAPRPVGMSMLLRIDRGHRSAELGIYLGERHTWGNGVGTEATRLTVDYAFYGLGLTNVLLRVVASNARAIKMYERAGFKPIGKQRGSYVAGGRAYDDLYMDCVPGDFESPVLRAALETTLGRGADQG